jgi:hypothetical protein
MINDVGGACSMCEGKDGDFWGKPGGNRPYGRPRNGLERKYLK